MWSLHIQVNVKNNRTNTRKEGTEAYLYCFYYIQSGILLEDRLKKVKGLHYNT